MPAFTWPLSHPLAVADPRVIEAITAQHGIEVDEPWAHGARAALTGGSPAAPDGTPQLGAVTVDGLIWAASMVVLDASRQPVPRLAAWTAERLSA